jgi:hypothetical protein
LQLARNFSLDWRYLSCTIYQEKKSKRSRRSVVRNPIKTHDNATSPWWKFNNETEIPMRNRPKRELFDATFRVVGSRGFIAFCDVLENNRLIRPRISVDNALRFLFYHSMILSRSTYDSFYFPFHNQNPATVSLVQSITDNI